MTENQKKRTERDRLLSRRDWLMIYLPLGVGLVLFLALLITLSVLGFQEANLGGDPASAWGDTAAIIVILEVMVISLFPLILLVGLCALFFWLFIKSQPVLRRGQEITEQIYLKVDQSTDAMVTSLIKPYLFFARVRAISGLLRRKDV